MQKYYPKIKLFFCASGISFMGSLPIGTLNTSAATIAINKGMYGAMQFSAGAILVEMIVVRIALFAVKKTAGVFFKWFSLLCAIVVILIGVTSLIGAFHAQNPILP